MGVMQQFNEPNIITTSTDKLFNWARKNSLWPLQFGLACCAIEMMSTGMAHNDLDRFGAGFFAASPRQADVMIVSGTVSTKMAERMTRLYEQMPEPKWVIAMGACAISGGPFLDGYSVLMGADRVIPVDVYVPGCPPRPEALIFGIMTLQKKIERDQQVGYERSRPALVTEDGDFLEYLPERDLSSRLERYLDGFKNRHGLEEAEVVGDTVRLVIEPGIVPAVLTTARESLGILHLAFITVVDREGSFEITYELLDFRGARVRVKTTVEGEEPVIDSVTGIYPTANWHEREAYDMFGVAFKGHPDLRRTYMWQDHFDHHPLLKSFEISTKRTFEGLR